MRPPLQPKIASSSATVAPLFAARVAAILRKPCADPETPNLAASVAEQISEQLFSQRFASFANDETQIAARSSRKRRRKHRQDRQHYFRSGLFRLDGCYAIADVLTAKAHGVTPSQSGVKQHIKPSSLPRSDWPARFIPDNVFLRRRREAIALGKARGVHVGSRIDLHKLRFGCPMEKSAHRFKKTFRLCWRRSASVSSCCDSR